MTNVEKVLQLMERSEAGALSQAFVMVALEQYAHTVLNDENAGLGKAATNFINPEAWKLCARETMDLLGVEIPHEAGN